MSDLFAFVRVDGQVGVLDVYHRFSEVRVGFDIHLQVLGWLGRFVVIQ